MILMFKSENKREALEKLNYVYSENNEANEK